jgi:hypothetical protein
LKDLITTQIKINNQPQDVNINNQPQDVNIIKNNTFNLSNFLNTQCIEAPNFQHFIFSLQIEKNDLDFLQKNGYIQSYENIIIKHLKNMDQTKRPIHCLDKKRKKFILKDNDNWTKENIKNILHTSILHLSTLLLEEYNKTKTQNIDIDNIIKDEILSPYNEKKMPKIESVVLQNMLNFTIEKNKKPTIT